MGLGAGLDSSQGLFLIQVLCRPQCPPQGPLALKDRGCGVWGHMYGAGERLPMVNKGEPGSPGRLSRMGWVFITKDRAPRGLSTYGFCRCCVVLRWGWVVILPPRVQLGQSPGILLPPLILPLLVHPDLQGPGMSVGRVGGDSKHFGAGKVKAGLAGPPGLTVRP